MVLTCSAIIRVTFTTSAAFVGGVDGELATLGFPNVLGGFTKAPFDTIGDTLRGTKGIMMDMHRRPSFFMEISTRNR